MKVDDPKAAELFSEEAIAAAQQGRKVFITQGRGKPPIYLEK